MSILSPISITCSNFSRHLGSPGIPFLGPQFTEEEMRLQAPICSVSGHILWTVSVLPKGQAGCSGALLTGTPPLLQASLGSLIGHHDCLMGRAEAQWDLSQKNQSGKNASSSGNVSINLFSLSHNSPVSAFSASCKTRGMNRPLVS